MIPDPRFSQASGALDMPAGPASAAPRWAREPFASRRTGIRGSGAARLATALLDTGLLLAYAIIVAARMPQILLKGRFWAEEGAIYFLNGRDLPWYDALFAVHTGYLNLAASIATLLAARVVPIEHAPWVSTGFALLIQLCPALLLLTSGVPWLRKPWTKAIALLVLLAATRSGEVWMNAITSQFHLGICTALILALPLRGGLPGLFRGGLLILAPLSGPTSAFLAPLFIARGYLDQSRQRLFQGVILGCGGALQLGMVLLHPEPARTIGIGPRMLALVVYVKQILLPFLGTVQTQDLTTNLTGGVAAGTTPWVPLLISVACMAAIVLAAWRSRNAEVQWLLAGGMVIMTLSYYGALGQHINLLSVTFGDRYSYAPTALFGLVLLGIALTTRRWSGSVAALLVCVFVWTGIQEYASPGAMFEDGSSWPAEVANWRADPAYRVQFWPDYEAWRWPIAPLPGTSIH